MATKSYSQEELLKYWKKPWDKDNQPSDYVEGAERSRLLVKFVRRYADDDFSVMEIGSNVGRNLEYLRRAGYEKQYGIEPSKKAVRVMKEEFPDLVKKVKIHTISVEEVIKDFDDKEFDVVFTMATFEHIHSDSEWVFEEVGRVAGKLIITIEDEVLNSWRHFPRNYKKIFESLRWRQVEEKNCLGVPGLNANFTVRVFKKMRGRPKKKTSLKSLTIKGDGP